jgi:putative oxidoreductase
MKKLWKITKSIITSEYLSLLLRFFIGIMFIYASMTKIPYPAEFAKNVEAYRILPYWSVNVVAVFLPWMELSCGLFLIVGLVTRASAAVLTVVLALFTLALLINVLRGSPITCGCFESAGEQISWYDIFRDLLMVLMTAQIAFFDRIFIFRRGGLLVRSKRKRN